jgi:hypothetical protein
LRYVVEVAAAALRHHLEYVSSGKVAASAQSWKNRAPRRRRRQA